MEKCYILIGNMHVKNLTCAQDYRRRKDTQYGNLIRKLEKPCLWQTVWMIKQREQLWTGYFTIEKGIYEQILSNPAEVVSGTVKELADKYQTEVLIMTGFLDGINESLKGYENPIETMDENTQVKIEIDPEKLYYNMVEAKAEWLYTLPQWDSILSEEKRKELYKQQKASGTVRKAKKVFPERSVSVRKRQEVQEVLRQKCIMVPEFIQ